MIKSCNVRKIRRIKDLRASDCMMPVTCSSWLHIALILTEFHKIVTDWPTNRRTDPFKEMRVCIKRYALAFSWPLLGSIYWKTSIFSVFFKSVINGRTDGQTEGPTDGQTRLYRWEDASKNLYFFFHDHLPRRRGQSQWPNRVRSYLSELRDLPHLHLPVVLFRD